MEKKPIKRNENIAKLSRDHHASLLFCFKLRQGIKKDVSTERMVRYVQYFEKQHFIPHFTEEEEILFAPLNDGKVQKAIDDHVAILRLVKEISFSGKENLQKEFSIPIKRKIYATRKLFRFRCLKKKLLIYM